MDSVLDRWPAPSMCLPVGQWTGGCPGRGVAETILPEHQEHPPESHTVVDASPLWSKDPLAPATQRMLNTTYRNQATLGISAVLFLSHLPHVHCTSLLDFTQSKVWGQIFKCLCLLHLPRLHLQDQKLSKISNIVNYILLQFKMTVFNFNIV